MTFFKHPLATTANIIPKINRVFIRDYENQNLTEYTSIDKADLKTTLEYVSDSFPYKYNCLCNYLLEEVNYFFKFFKIS